MKSISRWAALAAVLAVGATAVRAGALERELAGSLVRLQGGKVVKADGALAGKKIVAVYYSAHWCPPCRAFTPQLVAWYDAAVKKYPGFELIFVSSDRSAEAMAEYMAWGKMNWLAVAYDQARTTPLAKHAANGIPYLIALDAEGKVLVEKAAGQDWMSPGEALPKIEALLKK